MKRNNTLRYVVVAALFAALITIMTAYICHIPVGVNGGYVHFGDALIYLAASILPAPYAIAAAAIGGGLADLLTAPAWALAMVIIKAAIALPFTSKGDRLVNKRNVVAIFVSGIITTLGYYLAESIMFGSWAAFLMSISGSLIQAGGSAVIYLVLAAALDKAHVKSRFLPWAANG